MNYFPGCHDFTTKVLRYLRKWGYSPETVLDIGAYHGEWALQFGREFPRAKILMIEALESKRAGLELIKNRSQGLLDFEIALLGAETGISVQFAKMETGSSVFHERSHFPREVEERETIALDELLDRRGERCPSFIKLDVQGYELEILTGGIGALAQADFVLMEVSLIPINDGCPSFAQIISCMDHAGFRPLDFCTETRRKDMALWQTDILFVNDDSTFLPRPRLDPHTW